MSTFNDISNTISLINTKINNLNSDISGNPYFVNQYNSLFNIVKDLSNEVLYKENVISDISLWTFAYDISYYTDRLLMADSNINDLSSKIFLQNQTPSGYFYRSFKWISDTEKFKRIALYDQSGISWSGLGLDNSNNAVRIVSDASSIFKIGTLDLSNNLTSKISFDRNGLVELNKIKYPDGTIQNTQSSGDIYWTINGNKIYFNNNVGIGSNPQYALDISGSININGSFLKNGSNITSSELKFTNFGTSDISSNKSVYLLENGIYNLPTTGLSNGLCFNLINSGLPIINNYNGGTNTTGIGYSIAVDLSNIVYYGGSFTRFRDISTFSLVKIDQRTDTITNVWDSSGIIRALDCDSSGFLYAGITHTSVSGSIQKFNPINNTWTRLCITNAQINDIKIDSSFNIIAAGGFTTVSGSINNATTNARMVRFNQSTSTLLSFGSINNTVNDIAFDNSRNIIIGGTFTNINSLGRVRIAKWFSDISFWAPIGTAGIGSDVFSIKVDLSNSIWAGGAFTLAGVVNLRYIAKWTYDTSSWIPASFLNNAVRSIEFDSSYNIYCSGDFTDLSLAFTGTPPFNIGKFAVFDSSTWRSPYFTTGCLGNLNVPNADFIYAYLYKMKKDLSNVIHFAGEFNKVNRNLEANGFFTYGPNKISRITSTNPFIYDTSNIYYTIDLGNSGASTKIVWNNNKNAWNVLNLSSNARIY